MHIRGIPRDMQINPSYEAMIPEIMDYLRESIALAHTAGVADSHILLDPGIGFGKTFEQNLMILNRLDEFTELGYPLLVGVSRKAFLEKSSGMHRQRSVSKPQQLRLPLRYITEQALCGFTMSGRYQESSVLLMQ